MIAVVAHKVEAWQVELAMTSGALCDVEYARVIRIRQILDLLELGRRLRAVGGNQLLIL